MARTVWCTAYRDRHWDRKTFDTFARNLHRHYDSLGLPLFLRVTTSAGGNQYTTAYGYDTAGRLSNVWHLPVLDPVTGVPAGSPTFTYGYTYTQAAPGALRIGATSGGGLKEDSMPYTVTRNASGANPALVANRTYEGRRDVLHKIENSAGGTVVSSYTYEVNPITQRTSVATTGIAFAGTQADWTWGYDALGQVTRADAPVNASDRAYEYDQIGNRKKTATGSLNLPAGDNWVANALNQYSIADGVALPTTPAPAPFDLDGNMTAGPVPGVNGNMPGVQPAANATDIKWDAEQSDRRGRILDEGEAEARRVSHAMPRMTNQNRLVSITIGTTTFGYAYDHLSRLITRRTGATVNGRYNYDGWNRIVDYGTSTTSPLNSYTWGLDLSGTLQGAGGVGGLLATRWGTGAHYFPTYDGNGNVSEYLAPTGTVAVHYEYDPFGNLTRLTGNAGTSFAYRFSTKPRDPATGLYYYGYRWFDPYIGRWPSRDPIEEEGGVNLYGFVGNGPNDSVDRFGMIPLYTPAQYHHWLPQSESLHAMVKTICPGIDIHKYTTPYGGKFDKGHPHYSIHHEFNYSLEPGIIKGNRYNDAVMGAAFLVKTFVPQPQQCCVFMKAMTYMMENVNTQMFLRFEGSIFDIHPPGMPPLYRYPGSGSLEPLLRRPELTTGDWYKEMAAECRCLWENEPKPRTFPLSVIVPRTLVERPPLLVPVCDTTSCTQFTTGPVDSMPNSYIQKLQFVGAGAYLGVVGLGVGLVPGSLVPGSLPRVLPIFRSLKPAF